MSKSLLLLSPVLLLLPTPGFAQDPFQGNQANPFGERPAAAEPFGGNEANADPFGQSNPKRTRQPAKAKKAAKVVMPRGDAEVHIRNTLGKLTTASFIELPLRDAIQQLSQQHDIPILINVRSLEEVGLSPDEPVSLNLRNVTLRSFLRLMLRELQLTYIIRDEIMMITSQETAEKDLVLQAYPFPKTLIKKSDKVIMAVETTVSPDQWQSRGGPCSVVAIENVLVVSASDSVHSGVVDFLKKFDEAFQGYAAKEKLKGTASP